MTCPKPTCLAVLAATISLVLAMGCGPTAYKITPVSASRDLIENTVLAEGGLFPGKIVLIDVEGLLLNGKEFQLLGQGENPVATFVEKLDKAAADPSVRAVVLRINSPGGSVTASDIMYAELIRFRKRFKGEKPVVAVMMDVAASGGYYIACAADRIVAHPTTVTGSIGVIMQMINFTGTMNKLGINADAITSGPMKDAGSPFRPMTGEERAVFQSIVDQFYDRFVAVVAAGRPDLDEARVRELADGRVYSGPQAMELGFVDEVGTLKSTFAHLKDVLDLDKIKVVTYQRPYAYKPNVYADAPAGPPQVNLVNIQLLRQWPYPETQFLYLWMPGS